MARTFPPLALALAVATGGCGGQGCTGPGAGRGTTDGYGTEGDATGGQNTSQPTSAGEEDTTAGTEPEQGVPLAAVLRRLNRPEYNNTIRDLLGTEQRPADLFPSDDPSFGFDNISGVQTVSPVQFELYERAADNLALEITGDPAPPPEMLHFEAEEVDQSGGFMSNCCGGGFWMLNGNGVISTPINIDRPGTYHITSRVIGDPYGPELPRMAFTVDGVELAHSDVDATRTEPKEYSQELQLGEGLRVVGVAFVNDLNDGGGNRNLQVDWFDVEGPIDDDGTPGRLDHVTSCAPQTAGDAAAACLRDMLSTFGTSVFRRPLTDAEIDSYLGLWGPIDDDGGDLRIGVRQVLKALLMSPQFLFRTERDGAPGTARELDDYELASRLSYLLWSSMPDDTLLGLAAEGQLRDDVELSRQAHRMLDDPRSAAFVENFAGQWLQFRSVEGIVKDYGTYPDFDESLRTAMETEMELFFRTFIYEDRGLDELLTSRETFVNRRLATHYGLTPPAGVGFERVSLEGTRRQGLLGQAGWLAVMAHTDATSPVRRGSWVLDHLLCTPPPEAPPDVPPFEKPMPGTTMREQLEAHRSDPACAPCHALMDPIGLALEHFDGVGTWRDQDRGRDIDAAGSFPDGTSFSGARELSDALAADPAFPRCAVEKIAIYGLGRGTVAGDAPYLRDLAQRFEDSNLRLRDVLVAFITSELFRSRVAPE